MTHGARRPPGWWLLWLLPAAALATDLATCSRKWVKMNDRNYNRAIRHYADCAVLGQALDPPARLKYQSNIIMNLRRTCNYFFNRSSLPTSKLIGVVREVARILEDFDEEAISEQKNFSDLNVLKSLSTTCLPPPAEQRTMKTTFKTCPTTTRSTTKKSNTCVLRDSNSHGYLLLMLVFFFVLITLQIAFLVWFCCCNHCMCLRLCRSETRCMCNDEVSKEELSDTIHMNELQHDLASLSSENVGSDSEFEALLKTNKVPKAKRLFHSKEVD